MIAFLILAVIAGWAAVGTALWRTLSKKRKSGSLRWRLAFVAFLLAWIALPVADEVLGAQTFKRLCDTLPSSVFNGAVSIGPGTFFNADGSPKWVTPQQFNDLDLPRHLIGQGRVAETSQMFEAATTSRRVRDWPMPITQYKVTHAYRPTGQTVLVQYRLGSPGGWLKRLTRWGDHAPYVCFKSADEKPIRDWIKF